MSAISVLYAKAGKKEGEVGERGTSLFFYIFSIGTMYAGVHMDLIKPLRRRLLRKESKPSPDLEKIWAKPAKLPKSKPSRDLRRASRRFEMMLNMPGDFEPHRRT
jgi:hypothetical protein